METGPPIGVATSAPTTKPIRLGYARCSTAHQELQSQLDALAGAQYERIFSEKISTRVKVRPELEKVLKLAYDIKEAASDQQVILTLHELNRLARNTAELMTLSTQLQSAGVQLELLAAPSSPAPTTPTASARCSLPCSLSPPSLTTTTFARRPWKDITPPRPKATTAADRTSSMTTR
ncbi:recombinase family protein [Nonomuraea sp. NPDC049400]|uniref:recombinase family protein n=1 Tax=Nonomuraea sp. NPDC049400 TaxID=3364352 RepID=UPI0037B402DC